MYVREVYFDTRVRLEGLRGNGVVVEGAHWWWG